MANTHNDALIFELRGRFLNLKYNHDTEKMNALKTDCKAYLSIHEDNEHNHIENTIHILKSLIDYNLNDNRESAYEKIHPMLENLEFGKKANIFESDYNRCLLITSIMLLESYKQASEILKIIEKSYEAYPAKDRQKAENLSWLYINFIEILIHSKLCSKTTDREVGEIKYLFFAKINKAREIILKEERQDLLAILSLKEAQFYLSEFSQRDSEYLAEMRKDLIQKEFEFWENIDEYPEIFEIIKKMHSKEN